MLTLDADAIGTPDDVARSPRADIAQTMYLAYRPSGWSAHALARQRGNEGQPGFVHGSRVVCEPNVDFALKGASSSSSPQR